MTTVLRTKWFMSSFAFALGVLPRRVLDRRRREVGRLVARRDERLRRCDPRPGPLRPRPRLRGDGRDEYWERLDIHATALAGLFVITAIIVMCAWEWAHGRDGSPYSQLGALGGLAYIASVIGLRLRS
jgi:hypothetical protein